MTFCMNVSRFMNLAAIFSLDLESQFMLTYFLSVIMKDPVCKKNIKQSHMTWHIEFDP